mmetsp:Transcript_68482/g.150593  ORF Transcript_68482/g.150593 Transcript_68482/m.150593 type:complete len:230 (-) Transcript_68482:83-772(-)
MRSIAMESGEMEDAAPLIQEPAAKSTKALLATTGGIVLMAIMGISLWQAGGGMTPEKVAINDAQELVEKNDVLLSMGLGTACREDPSDQKIMPEHANVIHGNMGDCEKKCNDMPKCRAMEYRTSEKRCELWFTPARHHVTVFEDKTVTGRPDFHCFVKSGRCETMKAHKKVLEDAMDSLLTHIKSNCMQGPSHNVFDKCSSTYAQGLLDANSRVCKAMQTACEGESVQC